MTEQTTSDVLLLETGMDYDELTEAAPAEVAALETNATEVEAESAEINDDAELSMRLAINNLYRNLNIAPENAEDDGWRLNAIHLFGTHELSTEEILAYFSEFSPSSLEWIDDASCNVVWTDTDGPARAMLKLTSEIKEETESEKQPSASANEAPKPIDQTADSEPKAILSGEIALVAETASGDNTLNEVGEPVKSMSMLSDSVKPAVDNEVRIAEAKMSEGEDDEDFVIVEEPPVDYLWRRTRHGVKGRHGDRFLLFVRFARDDDRKKRGAHLRSQFYLKYGNPHFEGIRSLVSRSLRRKLTAKQVRRNELEGKLERLRAEFKTQRSTNSFADELDVDACDYELPSRELHADAVFREGDSEVDATGHVWSAVAEQLQGDTAGPAQPRAMQGRRWQEPLAENRSASVDFDSLLTTFHANQVVRKARERVRTEYEAPVEVQEEGELTDSDQDNEEEHAGRHVRGRGEKRMRMHADVEVNRQRDVHLSRVARRSAEFDAPVGGLNVSVSLNRDRTRTVDLNEVPRRRNSNDIPARRDSHRSRDDFRTESKQDARDRLGKRKVSVELDDDEFARDDASHKQKDLRDVLRSRRTAHATRKHGGLKVVVDK